MSVQGTLPDKDPRPEWSKAPFYRFFDYLETEQRLLHLALHGIESLVRQEKLVEALHGVSEILGTPEEESKAQLDAARATANLARTEVEADFPLLHAHSLIGIWGALESLVEEVIRDWLRHRPSVLKSEPFAAVKVPLADFHRMKSADRIDRLLEAVRPQGGGGGFMRLEAWLSCVGLDGPLDEELRRNLVESWEVRNVYAHRRGVVDKKARDNCPWRRREWKLGQQIKVTHVDYGRYTNALYEYGMELIVRSGAKFGLDVREWLERVHRLTAEGLMAYDEERGEYRLTEAGLRAREEEKARERDESGAGRARRTPSRAGASTRARPASQRSRSAAAVKTAEGDIDSV